MAKTLISFPVDLAPQGTGVWTSNSYMWKKLEDIQDYVDCDFLCLFSNTPTPQNCLVSLPSERVLGLSIDSPWLMHSVTKAAGLKDTLGKLLENGDYQNLILFEPLLINLYLAKIGHRQNKKIIPWFSGNYLHQGLLRIKTTKSLFPRGKAAIKWLLSSYIVRYFTQVSSLVIADSPHLFNNKQKVVFAPSQTMNQKEMADLPSAPVGEKEPLSLLYVGRVEPLKGLHHLIQALSTLNNPLDYHLTIVGPIYGSQFGDYESTLRRLIREKGLSGNVTFTGNISDRAELEKYYLQADLFILPSLTEGTPKVIFEAMAYGLPVLASRVGGIPLVVRDSLDGLLFDPQNLFDLQAALERMLKDKSTLRVMGRSARKRSFEFSKEIVFQKLAQEINTPR